MVDKSRLLPVLLTRLRAEVDCWPNMAWMCWRRGMEGMRVRVESNGTLRPAVSIYVTKMEEMQRTCENDEIWITWGGKGFLPRGLESGLSYMSGLPPRSKPDGLATSSPAQ